MEKKELQNSPSAPSPSKDRHRTNSSTKRKKSSVRKPSHLKMSRANIARKNLSLPIIIKPREPLGPTVKKSTIPSIPSSKVSKIQSISLRPTPKSPLLFSTSLRASTKSSPTTGGIFIPVPVTQTGPRPVSSSSAKTDREEVKESVAIKASPRTIRKRKSRIQKTVTNTKKALSLDKAVVTAKINVGRVTSTAPLIQNKTAVPSVVLYSTEPKITTKGRSEPKMKTASNEVSTSGKSILLKGASPTIGQETTTYQSQTLVSKLDNARKTSKKIRFVDESSLKIVNK